MRTLAPPRRVQLHGAGCVAAALHALPLDLPPTQQPPAARREEQRQHARKHARKPVRARQERGRGGTTVAFSGRPTRARLRARLAVALRLPHGVGGVYWNVGPALPEVVLLCNAAASGAGRARLLPGRRQIGGAGVRGAARFVAVHHVSREERRHLGGLEDGRLLKRRRTFYFLQLISLPTCSEL